MAAPTHVLLESGDHLTRVEFHRRYCARPDIKKAELVEGVVHVEHQVRTDHSEAHAMMVGWLGHYAMKHPDLKIGNNATVLLDEHNELQPDAVLFRKEAGTVRANEDDYIEGAPQLVVEIALSSASYDLHDKLRAYQRNGVREYVVWRVLDGMIDWLRLREREYQWVEPDEFGVVESAVFPRLRLHIPKMLAGNLAGVLAELEPPPTV